ncbi:MAG: DUF1513 domain-containing protein [Burkholderiaceae bacterium]|nr:DUF1513 domain-containing protein [Burkholderiaceae bacterium]
MERRDFLLGSLAGALAAVPVTAPAADDDAAGRAPAGASPAAPAASPVCRLATTWRGASPDDPQQIGILDVDWEGRTVRVRAAHQAPGRGHGLLAEADGGVVAVAFRQGTWLWKLDAQGQPMRTVSLADEPGGRRFAGHLVASADDSALLTSEFDPHSGEGWISVRDRHTLRKLDEWRCHGTDPHQMLLDSDGHLVIANGGVVRTPDDRKRDVSTMDSSLVLLDGRNGALRGQWRLPDRRLSLRHIAWNTLPGLDRPLLGVALQAEHDDPARRAEAPVFAAWDGRELRMPTRAADGGGYAGDIAAVVGGFVVSCQQAQRALWWRHDQPAQLTVIARMQEAGALTPTPLAAGGVVIAGAKGIGRWHPQQPAAMLPWPQPMALGSHWVELKQV